MAKKQPAQSEPSTERAAEPIGVAQLEEKINELSGAVDSIRARLKPLERLLAEMQRQGIGNLA